MLKDRLDKWELPFDFDRKSGPKGGTIGLVGLGLIGGSFAKAYKTRAPQFTVYATNRTKSTLQRAIDEGFADGVLDENTIPECDLILINLFPEAAIKYISENKQFFKPNTIVADTCGNKRGICEAGFRLAEDEDFCFIGAHPMAGTQFSGYGNSKEDMFDGSSLVLVPTLHSEFDITPRHEMIISRLRTLLAPIGFGEYRVTDAATHDRMIAYTSQLGHIMASSYVRNPAALESYGFKGGSWRDMTRIAYCNSAMWSELFIENKDNLTVEIDNLISELQKFRRVIDESDSETLKALLEEGSRRKEMTDHNE
ncbi:prephenate dehydrogenase [Ruminococcaceae bacterium YRB3002]|nr:prephenate dehydrogenase [Ruminococcaceae bacterium YRB3002]